ncbi:MAG: lipid II flippase Amj family protein [bacterium]|nr:lipid II flippase Amj family protein [bacterium]
MDRLIATCILVGIIHMTDTLSLSVRWVGVKVGRVVTAASLFNILVLVSRTANLLQAPMVGKMVDLSIKNHQTLPLLINFRIIILSTTIGTVVGILLMPTFINIFGKLIIIFEKEGSILRLFLKILNPKSFVGSLDDIVVPRKEIIGKDIFEGIPKKFFLFQLLITGFYTIGVLSALYAGAIVPQYRVTASQLSGIINGIATVLFMVFVDPSVAVITDQALRQIRPQKDVRNIVVTLTIARLMGTILAQVLIVPCARLVALVATKM